MPDGRSVWRALLEAEFPLARLFGPEHGFAAQAQDTVEIDDSILQGLNVVSLYGERRRPDPEHLQDLDAVIIDIQEIGCRYYTYLYTAAALIEECEILGIPALICDRPNPIGADIVEGGALPHGTESEVGGYGLAPRHGLTLGEYAQYLRTDFARSYTPYRSTARRRPTPSPKTTIFWMEHYRREMLFSGTALPWKPPSPNLPGPDTALVYPGTCLFEGTNISEGRGTTRPFEIVGAPWLEAEKLRDTLSSMELPGVIFSTAAFVPTFSAFAGEACRGVQLHVTDPASYNALRTGVEMLHTIRAQNPNTFSWRPLWEDPTRSFIDHLAGGSAFRDAIDRGCSSEDAYRLLCRNTEEYARAREESLHYPGAAI